MLSTVKNVGLTPDPPPEDFTHSMAVLLGLVHGILADGVLNTQEVIALNAWLGNHQELLDTWPAKIIAERVRDVLADGTVTLEETQDLADTLTRVLGWGFVSPGQLSHRAPEIARGPYQHVEIPGHSFLLSGRFLYGTRSRCEVAVLERGGLTDRLVKPSLDYLVLGSVTETESADGEFPEPLKATRELRRQGHDIQIISELTWYRSLMGS